VEKEEGEAHKEATQGAGGVDDRVLLEEE